MPETRHPTNRRTPRKHARDLPRLRTFLVAVLTGLALWIAYQTLAARYHLPLAVDPAPYALAALGMAVLSIVQTTVVAIHEEQSAADRDERMARALDATTHELKELTKRLKDSERTARGTGRAALSGPPEAPDRGPVPRVVGNGRTRGSSTRVQD
jgi:hypothetical protein